MKYETLRIYDRESIGPLKIPIIPPGINPDDILPLVIEQEKRKRDVPYQSLIIKDEPEKVH